MTERLVSLECQGETVVVERTDEGVHLSGNFFGPGGRAMTRVGRTPVVGGLLPDGAVTALVRLLDGTDMEATCGGGAWIAAVDDDWPPLRFLAVSGALVPAPIPSPSSFADVKDAITPCAACGALEWTCADDLLRCLRCGHWETGWSAYGAPADTDREPVEPAEADASERWAAATTLRMTLEDLRSRPVYVAAGVPRQPRYAGGSSADGIPSAVSIAHGDDLTVQTAWRADPLDDPTRDALSSRLGGREAWPALSAPALSLWLNAQERRHAAAVLAAEPLRESIEVACRLVLFTGLRSGDSWALSATVQGTRVTVSGRGAVPARLRRLEDPVAELT